jgi:hypothetical protein
MARLERRRHGKGNSPLVPVCVLSMTPKSAGLCGLVAPAAPGLTCDGRFLEVDDEHAGPREPAELAVGGE